MNYIDRFKLDEKVAIVTGGSKGLGRAIAIGMGEAGAKVVVVSRTKNLIEETANEIISYGGEAIAIPVDVKNEDDIKKAVNETIDTFGQLDILVNNAGIAPMNPTLKVAADEWNNVIETDLTSNFLFAKMAVRSAMKEQRKGKIINIGSVLGFMASNVAPHYCAAKAGLAHLTKALALEWAHYNINVNCIAPGFFKTDMTKEQQENEAHKKFLKFKIPFKRLGEPDEVVPTAIFLASEAASYITGSTIIVDGGYTIW
jgi:2-deoxy-D-gluconate 3-dehydrogenase